MKEAAGNVVKASQIVGTAKSEDTPGAVHLAKEAAKNAVETSQIVGATEVAETPGAA